MKISELKRELTKEEFDELVGLQKDIQQTFREHRKVEYLGKEFDVFPTVFPPRPDSMATVENMNIRQGTKVLDVCCGSGVVGIFASLKGAGSVLALDINPEAVKCATHNAEKHNCKNYEARVSDVLGALKEDEKFDFVTMNPPFMNIEARDFVESTMWDTGLHVLNSFFENIEKHLSKDGVIYMANANFGALDKLEELLNKYNFEAELIGEKNFDSLSWPSKFYAFKITKKL